MLHYKYDIISKNTLLELNYELNKKGLEFWEPLFNISFINDKYVLMIRKLIDSEETEKINNNGPKLISHPNFICENEGDCKAPLCYCKPKQKI